MNHLCPKCEIEVEHPMMELCEKCWLESDPEEET